MMIISNDLAARLVRASSAADIRNTLFSSMHFFLRDGQENTTVNTTVNTTGDTTGDTTGNTTGDSALKYCMSTVWLDMEQRFCRTDLVSE